MASVATLETYPLFAYLTGGIVNFAIPSAGGEFAVIGPSLINAVIDYDIYHSKNLNGPYSNIASVSFPMTPGTKKKDARKAVDPKGYLGDGKRKKQSVGYTEQVKVIRR